MSLKLIRRISRSGRGLVLRIPRDIERALNLKAGDYVQIWLEEDIIKIKKITPE